MSKRRHRPPSSDTRVVRIPPSHLEPRTGAELIDMLTRGDMDLQGLLPWSTNYTFLSTVTCGEVQLLAVYKPCAGERPLWDFPTGTLCQREVAAYRLSEALGWDLVPPTVLRDGPHGPGSVQLFIDFEPEQHYFTLKESHHDAFKTMAVFDALLNNTDRKGGHCLVDRRGKANRFEQVLEVEYNSVGEFLVDYSENISKNGIFMRTDEPQPVETIIPMKITLPNKEVIEVTGRVVHAIDADLAALIDAWPALPEPVKAGIVAMVRAAGGIAKGELLQ